MSSLLWHTFASVYANRTVIADEDGNDLYSPRYQWSYQMRGPSKVADGYGFFSGWPASRGMSGDPSVPMYPVGNDAGECTAFEPFSLPVGGTYRPWYMRGQCKDGSGSPVAAANLDMFLTGTKVLVSSGISDQNGYYELPSPYFGVNHEIYANYANGVLVGATVNTLQPAL
jgi:hypothetical protein